MKKTMKTLLALMAGVMAFSACNKDALTSENISNTEVKGIHSFTAFTDGATKATIDGLSVKWQSGDAISVVVNDDVFDKYTLSTGEGTTSGTFDAEGSGVSGDNIFAVYPYRDDVEYYVSEDEAKSIASQYGVDDAAWYSIVTLGRDPKAGQRDAWDLASQDPSVSAFLSGDPVMIPAYRHQGDAESNNIKGFVIPSTQTVSGEEVVDPKAVVMVAKADESGNLAFKNVCSYIKVTPTIALKKIVVSANNGESLASDDITIDDVTTFTTYFVNDGGSSEVTLQASEDKLAADQTYYIAVLPGTLAGGLSIKFYTDDSNFTESKISTSFTFLRNKVYNGGSQPEAAPSLPDGALSGEFSVSPTKKVHFSKGNLQATYNSTTDSYTWGFAANQDDYISAGNTTIDDKSNGNVVNLFGWSTSATNYGINTSTENSDYAGDFVDWGTALDNNGTWRTLSTDEWSYLFNTRTVNGGTGEGKSYTNSISYGEKATNGLVLYPDNYSGSQLQSGTRYYALPEGVVFLPKAGVREGSKVTSSGGVGNYWSSTEDMSAWAKLVTFGSNSSTIIPNHWGDRKKGCSVRLVTDVN